MSIISLSTAAVPGSRDCRLPRGLQNMIQFQEELSSTENKVAFSRQAFNDSVMSYNTAAESFPNSFIAGMFSFKLASFLEIDSEEKREAPEVSFT